MKRKERKIPRFRGSSTSLPTDFEWKKISNRTNREIVRDAKIGIQSLGVETMGKGDTEKGMHPCPIDSVRCFIRIRREEKREREGRVCTCVQRMSGTRSRDRDFMVGE